MALGSAFEIRAAPTARDALEIAKHWVPDLMLIDWTLPDGSGADLIERLRAMSPRYATLPIVVVSGVPAVRALAKGIGAVPCPKPCDLDQLTAAIELAFSRTRTP
jgi:DNA-binding response OmpR family regulator